jgi:hypothetical protein
MGTWCNLPGRLLMSAGCQFIEGANAILVSEEAYEDGLHVLSSPGKVAEQDATE